MSEYLIGEKKQNIYTITLNRPEKRNAITVEMLMGICEMAESQTGDPEIRAIILRGEGKIFSAGVDFNSLGAEVGTCLGEAGAGGAPLRALIYRFQQYFNRLEAVEVPIICAMHGRALGLGIELALACDIRLMSGNCIWAMPELKLGVIADLGGNFTAFKTSWTIAVHGDFSDRQRLHGTTGSRLGTGELCLS